ncbi:MAG: hypothetical protein U0T36_11820 [Saprospiraceae bacterium]
MKNKISYWALIACWVVMTLTALFFYPRWQKQGTEATLSWDASGYYMYLPAIFIYNDIAECKFKDSILQKYQPTPDFQQAFKHEKSGHYVMKYSSGMALVSLPFFAVAHVWAKNSTIYPPDGFSYPYQVSIGFGLFLLSLIGMYFLRKVLLHFFKDSTVAWLLLIYVVGTNYINYAAVDQAMTHSTLFTIYCILLWATIRFYQSFKLSDAIVIGSMTGLATLIRPTEIISILLPLFWSFSIGTGVKPLIQVWQQHFFKLLGAAVIFGILVMIQPIYWKWVSGEWIVYSYGDQGFSWLKPHVYDYVQSYRCGWWRFTPMMMLPFFGLWPYIKRKDNKLVITIFVLLSFYIVTAWDVWDYGGTAGRAMVQYYPVLAFPLCALLELADIRVWFRWLLYPVIVLFAYLNIWWVYHAHGGQVQALELSRAYYFAKVGRWTADDEDKKLLDNKHVFRKEPRQAKLVYRNDFEQDTSINVVVKDSSKVLKLSKEWQFTAPYEVKRNADFKKWLRVKANFYCVNKEWDLWRQAQFIIRFYDGDKEVQANMIRLHRFLHDGQTKELYLDAKAPPTYDRISIFVWNADSDKEMLVDNLEVISFDE